MIILPKYFELWPLVSEKNILKDSILAAMFLTEAIYVEGHPMIILANYFEF